MSLRNESKLPRSYPRVPIVSAKLAPPRAYTQAIPRMRFSLPEDEPLPRLTLIRAPAGFGKTTLMQQWHDTLVKRRVNMAWVTLDKADNDASRLAAHVCAAVRRALGDTFPINLTGDELFADISLRCTDSNAPLVLMLDELEAITAAESISLLQGLARLTSDSFTIIAAGRAIPPLGQARLSLENAVTEVNSDALKFDAAEACAMLGSRLGSRITPEEAISLGEKLGGWAAGLQFACLALRDRADVAGFMNRAATHGAMADYLRDDVFSRLPAKFRDFLVSTSLFPVLTADLCHAVTGEANSSVILANLERAGLFIKRIEIDRDVVGYRFHDVFADFLRSQLALKGETHIVEIHRAASCWYSNRGLWVEAVDQSLKAGDRRAALELLNSVAMHYVGWGQFEMLLSWDTPMTTDEAAEFPYAYSSWLWAKMFAGHQEFVTTHLLEFQRRVNISTGMPPELQDTLAALEVINDCAAERFEDTLVKGQALLPKMRQAVSFEKSSITNVLAYVQLAHGDARLASETIRSALRSIHSSDRSVNNAYTHIVIGMIAVSDLRLADATVTLQQAFDAAVAERGPYSHAAGLCASGLGEALYEGNRIAEAETVLDGRLETVLKVGWPDCALNIALTAARIATLREDYSLANEVLVRAQSICAHRDIPRITTALWHERARIAILADDIGESINLERQAQAPSDNGFMTYVETMTRDIASIRLTLLRRESAGVAPRTVYLMAQAKQRGFRRRWLKLKVLHAIALSLDGRPEAATAEMAGALRVGLPSGFIRLFVDEGDAAAVLIRSVSAKPDIGMRTFMPQLCHLMSSLDDRSANSDVPQLTAIESPRNELTEREREIIDIAARGLSNVEIGHCLGLTVPTVKWHLQNAFRKLGVSNRTEAIFHTRQ